MNSYRQRGGLRWGDGLLLDCVNATYPFAKIEVLPDKIVFKVNVLRIYKKEIALEKNEIVKIELKHYFLNKGFLFSHTNMSADKILVFWSFSPKKLLDHLIEMGYEAVI